MSFWITVSVMCALVLALLLLAYRRGLPDATDFGGSDPARREMQVYRDQLREVERDMQRGVIGPAEADRLRVEVKRRILATDRDANARRAPVATPRAARIIGFVAIAALVPLAGWTYISVGAPGYRDMPLQQRLAEASERRENRPGQAEAVAQFEALGGGARPEADAELLSLLEQLRAALANRPDDLRGHRLLAQNEAAIGNYTAAYVAQIRVIELLGDRVTAADYARLADIMILAAGGYVSPEAEVALERALRRDPSNGTALYYTGVMYAQIGRPDMAFGIWRRLHDESDPDAPWIPPIRAQIEELAVRAGVPRYTLPPPGTARGPSAADVEAAAGMEAETREEMIADMVEGLAQRLAIEGGPPEDWSRLLLAYGVLGETERAVAIWEEAQVIFGADPEALDDIRGSAVAAGVVAPAGEEE